MFVVHLAHSRGISKAIAALNRVLFFDLSLRQTLVEIGAKVVRHGRYITFQLAEVDPSNYDDYKAAHWITEEGVNYNYEKFREQGIPEPTTLSDLL